MGTSEVASEAKPTSEAVLRSDLKFQPLNLACGDASPKAGVFFGGDNKKGVTSGVLLKFSNGFSSPPHIYNISCRGVVISGTVHNGTPNAKTMWMGLASYWTQLASEMHIVSPFIGSELVLIGRPLHLLAGSIASDQR